MEDTFSSVVTATSNNITALSRTVTTATALASSYGDVTSAAYQQAMSDITGSQVRKRWFNFSSKAPSEIVRQSFGYPTRVSPIFEGFHPELLSNLPAPSAKYSLFQGFEASVVHGKLVKKDSKEPPQLENLNKELECCGVRKELATYEINEIDRRIAELQMKRKVVFNCIAEVEQEERSLERVAESAKSNDGLERISDIVANGTDSSSTRTTQESIRGSMDSSARNEGPVLSSNKERLSKRLETKSSLSKLQRHRPQPTLQQFYSPGELIQKIEVGKNDPITALDFDLPFGNMVVAAGRLAQVWDLTGNYRWALDAHKATIWCLHLEDKFVVTGGRDAVAYLWDIDSPALPLSEYRSHKDEITAVHMDRASRCLVTGSLDKTVKQWDLATERCVQTLDLFGASRPPNSQKWDNSVPYSTIGSLQNFDAALATGTADGIVRLWDLRAGQMLRKLMKFDGPVSCLKFDDRYLVAGSLDQTVRVWDLRKCRICATYAHEAAVTYLDFDPKKIVTATKNGAVAVHDRTSGIQWTCGDIDAPATTCVRFMKGYLVKGDVSGTVSAWAC